MFAQPATSSETPELANGNNFGLASTAEAPHLSPLPVASLASDNLFSSSFGLPLREARDAFERAYFEYHLIRESGSMTRVAEKTGLERTHLYRKLKQLGVDPGKLTKKGG